MYVHNEPIAVEDVRGAAGGGMRVCANRTS